MGEVFKDEAARERMLRWHERFRGQLRVPTESVEIATSFGDTHALVGGPQGGVRVVLLHDAMESSAHATHRLEPLLKRFRIHVIDVIGQSPRSAERRLSVEGADYGRWLGEVLDELGLARAHLIAMGWGGFVALRLAALDPERIERLALMMPCGIIEGEPWPGPKEGFWSSLVTRITSSRKHIHKAIGERMSAPDPEWSAYLEEALGAYRPDPRRLPLVKEGELDGLAAPTLILAADLDQSLPGPALLTRAAQIIPSLTDSSLLRGCRHLPPTDKRYRQKLSRRVGNFILQPEPRWSKPFIDTESEW